MNKIKNLVMLQGVVIIYSISSVMSKVASKQEKILPFILFFGLEFVLLGIYALLWQQMIKKFDLTVAYANRAMVILWSTIWAIIFFHDEITLQNVLGIILVMIGTFLVNSGESKEANEHE